MADHQAAHGRVNALEAKTVSIGGSSDDEGSSHDHGAGSSNGRGGGQHHYDRNNTPDEDRKASALEYRDFSSVPPDPISEDKTTTAGAAAGSSASKQQTFHHPKDPSFVVKLHAILSNPEYEHIISWLPHGRSWRIVNHKLFEELVIPLYYRHSRFVTFTRQVCGWGFQRITSGADFNSYYHEKFLRRLPHLCLKMKRLTSADMAERRKQREAGLVPFVPDFYKLDKEKPLPSNMAAAETKMPPMEVATLGSSFASDSVTDPQGDLLRLQLLQNTIALRISALTNKEASAPVASTMLVPPPNPIQPLAALLSNLVAASTMSATSPSAAGTTASQASSLAELLAITQQRSQPALYPSVTSLYQMAHLLLASSSNQQLVPQQQQCLVQETTVPEPSTTPSSSCAVPQQRSWSSSANMLAMLLRQAGQQREQQRQQEESSAAALAALLSALAKQEQAQQQSQNKK